MSAAAMAAPGSVLPALQRLRARAAGWLVLVVLAGALGAGWLAERAQRAVVDQELRRSAQVIGNAVAGELARALALGIPVDRLVGVDAWLDDQIEANPVTRWVALTDANGRILWSRGDALAELQALVPTRRAAGAVAWSGGQLASVALLQQGQEVGWVHVATARDAWSLWSIGLALAWVGVLAAVVVVGWRRWSARGMELPLQRAQTALQQLAQAQLPVVDPGTGQAGTGPAAHLLQVLDQRLAAQHVRCAQLQLKAGEVRAAHFDPEVLERIDRITRDLARLQGVAPERAHAPAQAQRAPRGMGVFRAVLVAGFVACLGVGLAVWGGLAQWRAADERQFLVAAEQILRQAWQATLEKDRTELQALEQRVFTLPEVVQALQRQNGDQLDETLATQAPEGVVLSVLRDDGTVLASSARRREDGALDRSALATLAGKSDVHGVWQSAARGYRSGHARQWVQAEGPALFLVVTQPLASSLAELGQRTGFAVALADVRGQAVVDATGTLLPLWTARGRRSFVGTQDGATVAVTELPLTALSGHTLGKVVAAQPLSNRLSSGERSAAVLAAALALVLLGLVLHRLLGALAPLRTVASRLDALAWDARHDARNATVRPQMLLTALERVDEKIEALDRVRRSRLRQGKRQARFIRHQMLELASRLDAQARAAVLSDLERIEHAGAELPHDADDLLPATPEAAGTAHDPRLEKMADEVGVLALGFQSLVSRVGDQYQELGRLVEELREALRVKTRFIAIQQELEIARKMQLSFLPHEFHLHPQLDLFATMQPAKEVGGDFYDCFALDADRVAVVVADVSGKGVPAAFFMAVSRTLLRAVAQFGSSPSDCLQRLNDLLASNNEEMMFVTLFYAIVDLRDGSVHYANGGHNPPYVLRADGRVEVLASLGDVALAVMDGLTYAQATVQLAPGDGLFLFTDGVTEACDIDKGFYGEARLEALLATLRDVAVTDIPAQVAASIRAFERGAEQADDITCVALRRRADS